MKLISKYFLNCSKAGCKDHQITQLQSFKVEQNLLNLLKIVRIQNVMSK